MLLLLCFFWLCYRGRRGDGCRNPSACTSTEGSSLQERSQQLVAVSSTTAQCHPPWPGFLWYCFFFFLNDHNEGLRCFKQLHDDKTVSHRASLEGELCSYFNFKI